ncbi:MAG: tetratricopeptide repeat protein [Deltaproteobacteria bacterium]|nr:tetratricopeptide repeat protein [Deltaproteobacteria bacterium]
MPITPPASPRVALGGRVLTLLLLVSAAVPVRAAPAADHLRAWQKAQAALQAGQPEQALELLEEAHRLAPDEPLYTYHLGHLQERLGFNAGALQSLTSVLGHPGLDPALRELAATKVEVLQRVADKAVLRLRTIPREMRVQVDEQALWESRPDLPVAPGVHLVCVIDRDSVKGRCWHLELVAGRRFDWTEGGPTGERAFLHWPGEPSATRLYLDRYPLIVDLSHLDTLEVDAGTVDGAVGYATGEDRFRFPIAAGELQDIPTRSAPRVVASGSEADATALYARSERHARRVGPVPWIVAGTGLAAVAVGAVFLAGGASDRRAVEDARASSPGGGLPVSSLSYAEAARRWDDGNSKTRLGGALVGVGAGLAAGGVLWWVLARRPAADEPATGASVWTAPGAAGVTWRGTFR